TVTCPSRPRTAAPCSRRVGSCSRGRHPSSSSTTSCARPTLAAREVSRSLTPGMSVRDAFPIFEHTVYANSCSQGALSHLVRAAVEEWLAGGEGDGGGGGGWGGGTGAGG